MRPEARTAIAFAVALSHWALMLTVQTGSFFAYLVPAGSQPLDALKHLGTIPAPRNLVSIAIGGPQRKTLYSVTAANVDGQRKVWIESIPLLATGPKGRGK